MENAVHSWTFVHKFWCTTHKNNKIDFYTNFSTSFSFAFSEIKIINFCPDLDAFTAKTIYLCVEGGQRRSQTAAININKQKKTFVKYPLHKLANFFLFKTWLFDFVFFFKNKSRIDAEVVLQLLAILVCSKTDGFLFENIAFCNLGLCGRREKLQNLKKNTLKTSNLQ